jgi:hypothetical protein
MGKRSRHVLFCPFFHLDDDDDDDNDDDNEKDDDGNK